MGAICSGKTHTAVDSHHSVLDQCDSVEQTYANHDVSALDVKPSNTVQAVEYISASETSLQKETSLPRNENTMPARLGSGDVTAHPVTDPSTYGSIPGNLQTAFRNLEKAEQLFDAEMKKENSETDFRPIRKVLKQDISDMFDKFKNPTDREAIGQYMAKIGLVGTLVRLYDYIIDEIYVAFTLATLADEGEEKTLLKEIRKILWNFSDRSPEFQVAIAETRLMFGFLAKDLQEMRIQELNQINEDSFPFTSAVNIIHNCSRSANVTKDMYTVTLQPGGGDEVSLQTCLNPFLRSSDTHVKLITLLTLAHIMDDKENKELLVADQTLLDFLLEMIQKATASENRRHQGFSVEELLDGLSRLARNDNNKVRIMNIPNAYTLIKEIVERGDELETIAAVQTIWELTFDDNNRMKVKNDTDFVKKLTDLKKSRTAKLSEVASYACFVIEGSDDSDSEDDDVKHNTTDSMVPKSEKKNKEPKDKNKESTSTSSFAPPPPPASGQSQISIQKPGHIMLSYNWSHKPVLLKVYDSLTAAGFPVWMDVYHMKGNLLDAMSEAVLESNIVVICVSEQYAKSLNCRTEAEFARKKKKIIIPFMMQRSPNIPGWLDMLLGEKLFYKFYDITLDNMRAFETRMKEVIDVISGHMKPGQPRVPSPLALPPPDTQAGPSQTTVSKQTISSETTTTTAKPRQSKQPEQIASQLDSWTEDDIDKWLRGSRLHTYAGMKIITCEQLQFLVKISVKAPEFFYRSLKEEVGLKGLEQLMRVSNAIEKLV